jgi:multiple sugar transport system permease protein
MAALFLSPAVILLIGIILFPLARGIYLGLTDANSLTLEESFIGLGNYRRIALDPLYWTSLTTTILWTAGTVCVGFPIALLTACLLNEDVKARPLFRALLLVPWVTPTVVASVIWMWMYSFEFGMVNYILKSLGIITKYVSFLASADMALPAVLVAAVWKGIPFQSVVLLAGLQGIPQEMYDAAKVDGASMLQRFRHVTIPQLRSIIVIVVILQAVWAFNGFDMLYVLTRGGPGWATYVMSIYVYLSSFQYWEIGYGAALATTMLIMMLIAAVVFIRQVLRDF